MPTAYTNCLTEGATFKEFVLGCTKAFIGELNYEDDIKHYERSLAEDKENLQFLQSLSPKQISSLYHENLRDRLDCYKEQILQQSKTRNIYLTTLKKVEDSDFPENLKKFMISQLEDSIKYDIYFLHQPTIQTEEEFYQDKLTLANHSVALSSKNLQDAQLRLQNSKEFIEQVNKCLT